MSHAAMGEGIAAVDTQRRNVGDLRAGEAAQGGYPGSHVQGRW